MTSIVTRLRSQASLDEYMEPTLLVERYSKERVEAASVIEALTAALEAITYEDRGQIKIGYHGDTDVTDEVGAALALAKTHKGE